MAVVLPNRKLLVIPAPQDSAAQDTLIATCKAVRKQLPNGDKILFLPHHPHVLKILNNMEYDLQGCAMLDNYYAIPQSKEGYSPWWWQLETASFLASNERAFCTSTPRTGKTLSTLLAIDHLQKNQGQRAAIVVAPLTVAQEGAWEQEAKMWFPNMKVVMVHSDRENELREPADVYLINPDGLKIVTEQVQDMISNGTITIAAIDELTEYGNAKSGRWKAASVLQGCKFFWGLTGTPGKASKIYGQVKLIDPSKVPPYFGRWRDMTEVQVSQHRWVPKVGHEEVIKAAMSPCIRFAKEDVLDNIPIPEVVKDFTSLSNEQEELTNKLVEQLMAVQDDQEIVAVTASVLASKLLQVAGGVVRGEDGLVHVDCQPKLDRLEHYLRRTPHKKVIFSSFTALNDMLLREVRAMGFTAEKIDGSVTGKRRSSRLRTFLDDEDPHVLICHPRTTAFGVELASADHIICYGPPMTGSFMYQQMFERLSSSKQRADKTYVVHLGAGRQDKASFSALASGVNIERNIVATLTKEFSHD